MFRTARILWIAVWLRTSLSLLGCVIFQESFDYPPGTLTEISSGLWCHHGGQSGEIEVTSSAVDLNQTETEDVHVPFPGGPYPPSSPEAFLFAHLEVRFTALPSGATGGYFAHFKDASTGYRCRLFATTNTAATGKFRLGLSSAANSPSVLFPKDLDLAQDYQVILQYCLSNATCVLWIDPENETSTQVAATDVGSALNIASFALRQNQGIGSLSLDDIKIGTSFTEVLGPTTNSWETPRIISPPQNLSVRPGESAWFAVTLEGAEPFGYQWQFNGTDLPQETNSTLVLTNLDPAQAGNYRVVVTNPFGTVTSPSAVLTVEIPTASGFSLSFTNYLGQVIRPGDLLTNSFLETVLNPNEYLVLEVAVSHQSGYPFELRFSNDTLPTNAYWEPPASMEEPGRARFHFQPAANQAGHHYAISLDAVVEQAITNWTWQIYVPTPEEQAVVINEFLANPATDATSRHFNPLGRNPPPSNPAVADEYVEIVNVGPQVINLAGWSVSDNTKVRHRFPPGAALAAAGSIVVYGGPKEGFLPTLDTESMPASEGTSGLGLNNTGWDLLALRNADGRLIARVVYPETFLSTQGSLTRYPGFNSDFVAHDQISSLATSPGKHFTGQHLGTVIQPNPPDMKINIGRNSDGSIAFSWDAEPSNSYSLWETDSLTVPPRLLTGGLVFPDRKGTYQGLPNEAKSCCFYFLSSP